MAVRDEIKKWTGRGANYWLDYIGICARKTAKRIKRGRFKGGLTCEPQLWLPELTRAVWRSMVRKVPEEVDGNIVCAKIMSLILTLWTCRIIKAKAYDARRPLKVRKMMMVKLTQYHRDLIDCVSDESQDQSYFPKQEWDLPFVVKAVK